jgi:hypothetical protein
LLDERGGDLDEMLSAEFHLDALAIINAEGGDLGAVARFSHFLVILEPGDEVAAAAVVSIALKVQLHARQ